MSFEHEKDFIEKDITDAGVKYAPVPVTKPIYLSYLGYFERYGLNERACSQSADALSAFRSQ